KYPISVLEANMDTARTHAIVRLIVNAVRIRSSFRLFSWMMNSVTPKSRSMCTSATSATATENTPTSDGVRSRLTIVTVAMLNAKLTPVRVKERDSALRTLVLADFINWFESRLYEECCRDKSKFSSVAVRPAVAHQ